MAVRSQEQLSWPHFAGIVLSAGVADSKAKSIEKLTKDGPMTDVAPVASDPKTPALTAAPRLMQRFDRVAAKASTSLSYTVMVGLLALGGAAYYERPTSRVAVASAALNAPVFAGASASAMSAAAVPVRSRPVTTLQISAGPKRETAAKTPVLEAASPVSSPQPVVQAKSAMVPPIKRVVPVTPPLPSTVAVMPPVKLAEAPTPKAAETPTDKPPSISPEAAPEAPPAAEPTESSGWPEAEVATALRQCTAILADRNVQFEHANPVRQGNCGTPAPIKLKAIGKPEVSLANPALMNCAVAVAVGNWVDRVLQPAAKEIFSSPVVRLVGTGSYTCRNRNGAADGPISEHAFGNAFDVAGFVLADGRTINVLGGWGRVARDDASAAKVAAKVTPAKPPLAPDSRYALKGPPVVAVAQPVQPAQVASTPAADAKPEITADARFLRRIHGEACKLFGTVLGPEANDAHRDHLHFDLKDRKGKNYCQ